MTQESPEEVKERLAEMPAWADVTVGDAQGLAAVERETRTIAASGTDTVMAGLSDFVRSRLRAKTFGVSEMSKVFVLNRLLFAVPDRAVRDQPRFGAFVGIPVHGDFVDDLWPWRPTGDGGLTLEGYFKGYSGEVFQAIEEAESFLRRYGPRVPSQDGTP